MKFIVELLAYGKESEVREVDFPQLITYDVREPADQILGLIYVRGQNEFQPQDHPSVSVGDVIRLGEDRYLILPIGFQRLSPTDYDAYKAIPRDQRAVRIYLGNAISKL